MRDSICLSYSLYLLGILTHLAFKVSNFYIRETNTGRIWQYSARKSKIISYILNAILMIKVIPILSSLTKIFPTIVLNNLGRIKTRKR